MGRYWKVQAAPELHCERVVAAASGGWEAVYYLVELGLRSTVCGSKQRLAEGLKFSRVLLDLRTEQIGKEVSTYISVETSCLQLRTTISDVVTELCLDSPKRREVIYERGYAAVDVVTGDFRYFGVNVDE